MTLQEKELLTRFLQLLAGARADHKDAEADALIKETVARQPDAAYLLVQRTMQLEQLLQASQAEVERLKGQGSQPSSAQSRTFLGDPNAWGRSAAAPAAQAAGRPGAMPPAAGASWGSGLFGTLAMTAAGVVAGSFLYQGIQGLMNRDDQTAANGHQPEQLASNEPEHFDSYDTSGDATGDMFGDGGDFV